MTESVEDIPQNQITIDDGLQTRVGLDPEVVDQYHQEMLAANGWPFPPVVIFRDELGVNRLADGFHRYAASLRPCRVFRVPAVVHRGNRVDALRFALGANAKHGLRRSRADIRRAILMALDSFPGLSDRSIADIIGCHHSTVSKERRQVANLATCPPHPPPATRTGRDGKRYRLDPKNLKPRQLLSDGEGVKSLHSGLPILQPLTKEETAKITPEVRKVLDSAGPTGGGSPSTVQAAGPAEDKTLHTDAHGHVVPKAILPMWLEAENVAREAIRKIDDVRGFVKRGVGSGMIWAEVSNALIGDLDASRYTLTCLKPYCLCPSCKGHLGCTRCRNRGWISEYLWKCTASRDEKKAAGSARGGCHE